MQWPASKYVLRLLPLVLICLIWIIGYAFRVYDPLASRVCDNFYGAYCSTAIGEPLLNLAKRMFFGGFLLCFMRLEVLRRWVFFGVGYLFLTTIALAFTSPTAFMYNRADMGGLLGLLFSLSTFVWIIVHSIVLYRRDRVMPPKKSF